MLINLGMYESMIGEALHVGILFYLSGLLSLLAGLAFINLHNTWLTGASLSRFLVSMIIGGIIHGWTARS